MYRGWNCSVDGLLTAYHLQVAPMQAMLKILIQKKIMLCITDLMTRLIHIELLVVFLHYSSSYY